MARFSQKWINGIVRDTDFVQLVKELTDQQPDKKGLFLCPFHTERTPSFKIYKERNLFICLGCGASGSPINFVMEYLFMSFREAVIFLARRLNRRFPKK